jgi:type IV pilus assembly protein PilE
VNRIRSLPVYSRGITLIELMVVVIVLGILGSIAVSSYRGYLLRSNRTEARIALLRVQAAQEKFFIQNSRYANPGELTSGLGVQTTTPGGKYTISLQTPSSTTYVATAAAAGRQTEDDSACHTMTINQLGARTPTGDKCWR